MHQCNNNNRIFINLYHFSSIIPQKTIFMDTFLYFNRIPKTGSENFAFLIHQLANVSFKSYCFYKNNSKTIYLLLITYI